MDNVTNRMNSFLKQQQGKLFKLAMLKTNNYDASLDIVQNTMLAMFQSYQKKSEQEWAYLIYRVLSNKVMDWKRKNYFTGLKNTLLGFDGDSLEDGTLGVEQKMMLENKIEKINQCLQGLSKKQKEVVCLKVYAEHSFETIATIVGISVSSVKTHYYRALECLKKNNVELCYE